MGATATVVRLQQAQLCCKGCDLREVCHPDNEELVGASRDVNNRGRVLERGDHLFRQGDPLKYLYVIRSGSVKSYVATADGLEQVVRFYLPGELVGLDALGEEIHTSSVQILETTSVCRFPYDSLEAWAGRSATVRRKLLRLAGREVAGEHQRAVLLAQRDAGERLAAFLMALSNQHASRGYSGREFNLSMSRQDIACFLALAVETVSRLFTQFQNQGLITVDRRHIQLLSPETLNAKFGSARVTLAG